MFQRESRTKPADDKDGKVEPTTIIKPEPHNQTRNQTTKNNGSQRSD